MSNKTDISSVRGIIFDLDGTLYTISWLKLTMTLGLLGDVGRLRQLFPVRAWLRDKQPFDSETVLKQRFSEEMARRTGGTPKQALDWFENRFMPRFITVLSRRGRVREGLIPLLEKLEQSGIQLAVVSDFGCVEERLHALGIPTNLFGVIVGAETYGAMKPSAVPYLAVADKWGLSPREILLVGDRADQDAVSATLVGSQFLGIAGGKYAGEDFVTWSQAVRVLEQC